jgi:hypothetical protein
MTSIAAPAAWPQSRRIAQGTGTNASATGFGSVHYGDRAESIDATGARGSEAGQKYRVTAAAGLQVMPFWWAVSSQ